MCKIKTRYSKLIKRLFLHARFRLGNFIYYHVNKSQSTLDVVESVAKRKPKTEDLWDNVF